MKKMARDPRYHERMLRRAGYELIAGVDEAGRGALAGPLVAAAVILPAQSGNLQIKESKLLSAEQRQRCYAAIVDEAVTWSVAYIAPGEIDKVGIQLANLKVLREASLALSPRPDFVLSDGFDLFGIKEPYRVLIKGDRLSISIAAASIIAKVTRDSWMELYDCVYPDYGFHSHKGYGTSDHRSALWSLGPSPIHRFSYRPVDEASAGCNRHDSSGKEGDDVIGSSGGGAGLLFPQA